MRGALRGSSTRRSPAWFGLEYYATSGGLVLGLVFGVVSGFLMNRSIRLVRTRMAAAEENSAAYQKYAQKRWVRFLSWLAARQGQGQADVEGAGRIAEARLAGAHARRRGGGGAGRQRVGVPAVVLGADPDAQPAAGLEAVNGATVDLKSATLGFGDGQLRLAGRSRSADSKRSGKDLLAADEVVATIDTGALLRRRFVVDEVRATAARGGTKRTVPGIVIPSTKTAAGAAAAAAGRHADDRRLPEGLRGLEAAAGPGAGVDRGDLWRRRAGHPDHAGAAAAAAGRAAGSRKRSASRASSPKHLLTDGPRVLVRKVVDRGHHLLVRRSHRGARPARREPVRRTVEGRRRPVVPRPVEDRLAEARSRRQDGRSTDGLRLHAEARAGRQRVRPAEARRGAAAARRHDGPRRQGGVHRRWPAGSRDGRAAAGGAAPTRRSRSPAARRPRSRRCCCRSACAVL
jgi:hypothetical protein